MSASVFLLKLQWAKRMCKALIKNDLTLFVFLKSMCSLFSERECLSALFSDMFGHSASCFSPDDILVGFVRTLGTTIFLCATLLLPITEVSVRWVL